MSLLCRRFLQPGNALAQMRMHKHATATILRGFCSGAACRQQHQYSYDYQYRPRRWPRRLLYFSVGTLILSGYVYYAWWPKHTFPLSVAKILRKGLWAESDRGENDYQLALKHYIEALEHCNEIVMDRLSDEYTGVQLKVAEMFERLDMKENAEFIYNEIATLYMKVLTAAPDSEDGRRIHNREHRGHLIQKDLRIAIKLVELNNLNPQLSKAILMTHLLIAQDEVHKKLGNASSIYKMANISEDDSDKQDYKATLGQDSITVSHNGVVTQINKNPEAWEPFCDEFFNAMDLLTAICVATGDLGMASRVKISMTEWMLLADVDPHKLLLSQCNLASLLYLQAEEFEAQEISYRRKLAESAGLEYDKIKNFTATTVEQLEEAKDLVKKMIQSGSDSDKAEYQEAVLNKDKCILLSIEMYQSVLNFAKKLPQQIIENNATINETVALATYGLGVVHLHLSDYERAERLLREARVRSRSCGYDGLITEIERELGKLFKERKLRQKGQQGLEEVDIEMDIHIHK